MATLPFSMQGVIFAKRTSPLRNLMKPFTTSDTGRSVLVSTRPLSSETAAIGKNVTLLSEGSVAKSVFGFMSATSPNRSQRHPSGTAHGPSIGAAPAASASPLVTGAPPNLRRQIAAPVVRAPRRSTFGIAALVGQLAQAWRRRFLSGVTPSSRAQASAVHPRSPSLREAQRRSNPEPPRTPGSLRFARNDGKVQVRARDMPHATSASDSSSISAGSRSPKIRRAAMMPPRPEKLGWSCRSRIVTSMLAARWSRTASSQPVCAAS